MKGKITCNISDKADIGILGSSGSLPDQWIC